MKPPHEPELQLRHQKVFDAVFLGAAMQIPSLLQIEAECGIVPSSDVTEPRRSLAFETRHFTN